MDDRKIILDTYKRPQTFYKKKDDSGRRDRIQQRGQNAAKVSVRLGQAIIFD